MLHFRSVTFVLFISLFSSLPVSASEYIGERNAFNRFHGFGTYISSRGDRYEGNWVDGRKNGQGTQEWASGDKYTGTWSDNRPHGKGQYTYANGEQYIGDFVRGKRNGQGSQSYVNGDAYEGHWKGDRRSGKGTMKYAIGTKFEGSWSNNLRHGKGVLTYANSDRLVGIWTNDKFASKGTYIGKGWRYDGAIAKGKPNGVGQCTVKGKKSSCEYRNGKKVVAVAKKKPEPKKAPKPAPVKTVAKAVKAAPVKAAVAPKPKPKPAVVVADTPKSLPPIVAQRPEKKEKKKPVVSNRPEFYFKHNWTASGEYQYPSVSWFQRDVRDEGDLRIRTEDDEYVLVLTINDYVGPGEYELNYFNGTTSRKGVASFATSGDKPGTLIITADNGTRISGRFELTAYRNGNVSTGDSRVIREGRFTVDARH